MNPLLFIGSEYLFKMTDPIVPEEEQETYREALAAYLASDEGNALSASLVGAFNEFEESPADVGVFPRDATLWYLDWLTHQDRQLLIRVNPKVLDLVWQSYDDGVVRTRTIELILIVESLTERKPQESQIVTIFNRAREVDEAEEVIGAWDSTELGLVDTLLTDGGPFALQVLQLCLQRSRVDLRERLDAHIRNRADDLGDEEASELLAKIFPKPDDWRL